MNSVQEDPLGVLQVKDLKPGDATSLIIAVFGYEKMVNPANSSVRVVAGDHQIRVDGAYRASLVGRVHSLLESKGLEVLGIEQTSSSDNFALLIHASYYMSDGTNLSHLRKDLEEKGKQLGVTIRVQREELFTYMHRI